MSCIYPRESLSRTTLMDNPNTVSFIRSLGDYRSSLDHKPSWLKLTTITMVSSYLRDSGVKLDLDRMKLVFRKMKYLNIKQGGCWRRFYSTFYNQITIGYEDSLSVKKVKIFPNGSLQIAGCRDPYDCKRFINQLQLILKWIYNVDIPESSFKIVMINSNFSLKHVVNQNVIFSLFRSKPGFAVSFDPDRYSAVKMKFTPVKHGKQVTISVFSSGSVIITGAQTLQEVFEAYKTIVNTISHNFSHVCVEPSENTEDFDYFMGYPYSKLYEKISKYI